MIDVLSDFLAFVVVMAAWTGFWSVVIAVLSRILFGVVPKENGL